MATGTTQLPLEELFTALTPLFPGGCEDFSAVPQLRPRQRAPLLIISVCMGAVIKRDLIARQELAAPNFWAPAIAGSAGRGGGGRKRYTAFFYDRLVAAPDAAFRKSRS